MALIIGVGRPATDIKSINGTALTPRDWSQDFARITDFPKTAAGNPQVAIAESTIQVPVDVQSILASKYAQLLNANETAAQSVTLDTEGCKLLEVYATAAASTTFHLDVSNDNTNWFTDYKVYSAVTKVTDTLWNGFRYVKLRSDAAGSSGNTVTLSLAAKP